MLRRRLRLEWWAAVAVVTAVVLLGAVLVLPGPDDQWWSLIVAGVIGALVLMVGVGAIVAVYKVPVGPAPLVPGRFRDRDVAAATTEVRGGRAVDPPELQAAAIDLARRGLRPTHLTFVSLPMSGVAIVGNLAPRHPFLASVVAVLFLSAGLAGLGQSRRVQDRLDALEDTHHTAQQSDVS